VIVPPENQERIAALKPTRVNRVGLRLLEARSIGDLFGR